jgi:hypothetical protein
LLIKPLLPASPTHLERLSQERIGNRRPLLPRYHLVYIHTHCCLGGRQRPHAHAVKLAACCRCRLLAALFAVRGLLESRFEVRQLLLLTIVN